MTRRLGVMTRVLIESIFGDHRLWFTRERVSVEPGLHGNETEVRTVGSTLWRVALV